MTAGRSIQRVTHAAARRPPVATTQRNAVAVPPSPARALQQRLGNQGAQLFAAQVVARSSTPGGPLRGGTSAGQFSLSHPDDASEREADRVADVVMRTTAPGSTSISASRPTVQRVCADCEEETSTRERAEQPVVAGDVTHVHRSASSAEASQVSGPVAASIHDMQGGGAPLPDATRAFFEPRFGADFSHVRVHTGAQARETAKSIDAKAFTVGRDIAFAGGQYSPDSDEGQKLLAHELTHVVQQRGGAGAAVAANGISNAGGAAERQADAGATQVAAHGTSARLPASLMSVSAPASRATVYRDPQRDVARAEPPPAAIDSDLEDRIRAELNQVIAPTKGKALRAREQRLTIIFKSVVGLDRTTLLERLSKSQHNDTLARLFNGRLHTATRNRLISRLRGEPVPLPAVTDAMTLPAFRQQLSDDSIILSPAQPLIDDTFQPRAIIGWFPRAELGPPMDEPPVAVQWEVYDPAHEVVFGVTSPWDTADPVGHSNRFETDKPGTYHISGRIIQGGLLVAEFHRFFDVTKTKPGSEGALAGALGIEAEQRQQQFDQRRAKLAGELSDDDRKRIGQELAKLEFAGSQVGQQLQQPVAAPADAHNFRGLILSTDPAHCRSLIEDVYTREGESGIPEFLAKVYHSYHLTSLDIDPRPDNGLARSKVFRAGEACRDALMRQWELLQKDIAAFLRQFQESAEVTTRQMLQLSDAKCDAEIEKYGLEQHVRHHEIDTSFSDELGRHGGIHKYTTVDYSGGTNDKAQEMQRAAAELAASQRELDKLRKRRAEVTSKLDLHGLHERRVTNTLTLEESLLRQNDLIDDIVYGPPAEPRAQLEALLQSLDRLVAQAEEVHSELIVDKTERFAVLASYKKVSGEKTNVDPGGLEKLAVGPVAGQIGPRIFETKKNIATTLTKLGDKDLSIWKEPRLVQLTMPQMLVVPGSWRERAVEEEAADASRPSWKDWALMAVTFALVALTFIPTGGGSALVGGIVIAAELGGLALDIYLISEQIEQYQLDKAKASTDLDKAHAVSASEPTLFWLAVDIIATAVGLGLAAKTFKEINHARKMAMTAVDATKVDEALAFIHAQAREGKISAKAAARLEDEVRAAGKAAHLEEAGEAAAVGRTPLSDADLPSMEARLGVPVERSSGLTHGVRVEFDFDGDKLRVTRVLVGTASTIEDVLAHRRTISRITRYNGAIGKLRRVWDEIVVLLGGRVDINPFPTGSRAWASFEELSKLDDLIELRRTKLQSATGLDAKLLDDEIAFLEGEVWHHSEVVKTARETGEVGAGQAKWIERPDIGEVTKEALNKRPPYPLPAKHGEHYYYRRKVNPAKGEPEFELAIKPSAPDSLKLETYRTVMKNGKPALEIGPAPGRVMEIFTKHWDDADVLEAMTGAKSRSAFKQYAEMLDSQLNVSQADIKAAIKRIRKSLGDPIHEDDLRKALKAEFEPKVLEYMTNPRLSAKTSWQRMRDVTDKLNSSDKGNLVEDWYHTRFTPSAERHVAVSKGDLASAKPPIKIDEDRFIDIAKSGTAREIKSTGNALSDHDLEQFKDFLKVVKAGGEIGGQKLKQLRYVFTNPDAVASNLEWMKKALSQADGKLTIEVFNKAGVSRKISDASELPGLAAWATK